MADKNFKVKSGLQVPSLTTAGPVVTDASGNVTSSATLPIEQGGTGQTTANNALNALLPLQTGNNNYFLQTNQVSAQWAKVFYQLIKNAGNSVTPRGTLNIVGATFTDDLANDQTNITLPAPAYQADAPANPSVGQIWVESDSNISTFQLPTQTNNSGKYLTTNGTQTSWSLIANSSLQNSSITINGSSVSLGGSTTIQGESFHPFLMVGV